MSEQFRLDRKIGFQNTFYTKSINVIIDSIGPSIILRSIYYQKRRPVTGFKHIRLLHGNVPALASEIVTAFWKKEK